MRHLGGEDLEERHVDEDAGRHRLQHAVRDVDRLARAVAAARLHDADAGEHADGRHGGARDGGDDDAAPPATVGAHQLEAEAEANDELVGDDGGTQRPDGAGAALQADRDALEDVVQGEGKEEDEGADTAQVPPASHVRVARGRGRGGGGGGGPVDRRQGLGLDDDALAGGRPPPPPVTLAALEHELLGEEHHEDAGGDDDLGERVRDAERDDQRAVHQLVRVGRHVEQVDGEEDAASEAGEAREEVATAAALTLEVGGEPQRQEGRRERQHEDDDERDHLGDPAPHGGVWGGCGGGGRGAVTPA